MYKIEVTYPTGCKGTICHHVNDRDEIAVFMRDQDTGSYVEAEYATFAEANDTAADARFMLYSEDVEVEVVEVNP